MNRLKVCGDQPVSVTTVWDQNFNADFHIYAASYPYCTVLLSNILILDSYEYLQMLVTKIVPERQTEGRSNLTKVRAVIDLQSRGGLSQCAMETLTSYSWAPR